MSKNNVAITNEQESSAIKIKGIQAASLYRVTNNYKFVIKKKNEDGSYNGLKEYKKPFLDFGNAVINNSLFAKYVRKHGVIVNKFKGSYDFLMMKFDWGVDEDDSNKEDIKPAMTTQELRDYYYENDATVIWKTYDSKTGKEIKAKEKTITYQMLLRTPGKAKEGHCLFIKKELHNKVFNYLTMGLWERMPNVKGAKIVEMSAYAPLITATAIDYIQIPMENIFVLEDQKSSCYKKAIIVKAKEVEHTRKAKDYPAFEEYINQYGLTFYKKTADENPQLKYVERSKKALAGYGIDAALCPEKDVTYYKKGCCCDREQEKSEIANTLWDGMGIIDDSIFPENMEGFIYCRSHFFKSCLFRGNMQRYFKDYYGDDYDTAYETDMTGRRMKVTDIKVIVTENSLKWIKFLELMSKSGTIEDGFKYYSRVMKKDGEMFAIVKTAHSSKYDELQRSSFQMNNTLLTTDKSVLGEIAAPSIEYCNKLKTDDEAFLKYLEITGSARYSINNVLIALYRWNDEFRYMEWFKNKKKAKINEFKDQRLKLGKLFQYADNLVICGNPVAMLMAVTRQSYLDENCFIQAEDRIQCCTSRFGEGERLAGFRSPHNSPNNIVYLENVFPDAVRKYFPDLGDNVIIINGIGTDVQSRLNGQDLDTDSIYTTNQKDIVELAKKAYVEYPTIINNIKYGTNEYDKSMKSYSKMDANISSAQYNIGSASNIAQLALSYWFDSGCEDKELEDVFIICSVLAQVAIDSCKRSFEIKVGSELARIEKMQCMEHDPRYPVFYADVQEYNNKKKKGNKLEIKKSDVGFFNCPMDLLYQIIEDGIIDLRKHKELNTKTYREGEYGVKPIFEYKADKVKVDRKQYKKVIDIVKEYDMQISILNREGNTYHNERLNEFEICMEKLKNLTIKGDTMYTLIAYAFKSGNEDLRDSMLTVLYDKDKKAFLNCFKKTEKSSQKGAESIDFTGVFMIDYEERREKNVS
ncbi:hypothetical protein [Parablautia muri]|uniref:Uncharacterized protein n=1 Tax=Parablautia muri TaxID=2320879 RepID=A0A9X5BGX7_9FIRM|nr:hypothetical protein [Parablautia muri]NBJ93844.1 hypothetical protein [Parablautia muri]